MAHRRLTILGLVGWFGFAACGGDDDDLDSALAVGSGAVGGTTGTATGGGAGMASTPTPEVENEDSYTAPIVSGHWIWTANPLSGKVALINAHTMDVTTADAGLAPTYVAALGESTDDESAAVVLNVGSDTASVLTAVDGVISVDSVRVHPGANRMTVSQSGRWAIVWSDAALVSAPDPTEGLQDVTVVDLAVTPAISYPLTVGYRPSRIAIGAGEKHVYFVTEPGISVIDLPKTDAPSVTRDIPVTMDPTEAASLRDVTVTPDGRVAIVRRVNSAVVNIVSLESSDDVNVTLPGVVTDLDLAPDGTMAYAVVRDAAVNGGTGGEAGGATAGESAGGEANSAGSSATNGGQTGQGQAGQVGEGGANGGAPDAGAPASGGTAGGSGGGLLTGGSAGTNGGLLSGGSAGAGGVGGSGGTAGSAVGTGGSAGTSASTGLVSLVAALPLAALFDDPTAYSQVSVDSTVGSIVVAPSGDVAVLYTNATANDFVTILDTAALQVVRTVDVQAPVKAMLPSPDGLHAIALLDKAPGSQKAGGFSLIPLTTTLAPKVIGTDAPPQAVALGEHQGLVTVEGQDSKGSKVHAVFLAQLPGFSTKQITLGSPPVSAGLIPEENLGFIAQSHPEGRITFLNLDSGQPRTITGFELSSKVVQGE